MLAHKSRGHPGSPDLGQAELTSARLTSGLWGQAHPHTWRVAGCQQGTGAQVTCLSPPAGSSACSQGRVRVQGRVGAAGVLRLRAAHSHLCCVYWLSKPPGQTRLGGCGSSPPTPIDGKRCSHAAKGVNGGRPFPGASQALLAVSQGYHFCGEFHLGRVAGSTRTRMHTHAHACVHTCTHTHAHAREVHLCMSPPEPGTVIPSEEPSQSLRSQPAGQNTVLSSSPSLLSPPPPLPPPSPSPSSYPRRATPSRHRRPWAGDRWIKLPLAGLCL